MGNRLLTAAVAVLILVDVGLFAAVLLRHDDASSRLSHRASTAAVPDRSPSAGSTGDLPVSTQHHTAIVLSRKAYVARPFEGVRVAGAWKAPRPVARRAVRVEVQHGASWSRFPLPAVTDATGRFTAFVNLGARGRYRLRVLGVGGAPVSDPVTVTVR